MGKVMNSMVLLMRTLHFHFLRKLFNHRARRALGISSQIISNYDFAILEGPASFRCEISWFSSSEKVDERVYRNAVDTEEY